MKWIAITVIGASISMFGCMEIAVPRLIRENKIIATIGGLCGLKAGFDAASSKDTANKLDCIKYWTFLAASSQILLLMDPSYAQNGLQDPAFANVGGFMAGYCAGIASRKMKIKFDGGIGQVSRRASISQLGNTRKRTESITTRPANKTVLMDDDQDPMDKNGESAKFQSPEPRNLMDRDILRAHFEDPAYTNYPAYTSNASVDWLNHYH